MYSLVLVICFEICQSMSFSIVFFFKQKTAYEMRISDWSSDVCSSDLTTTKRGGGVSGEVSVPQVAEDERRVIGRPQKRKHLRDELRHVGHRDRKSVV